MIHITTYSLSVTVDIVFCDALQQRYKKPSQYICFSDVCLSYSGGIPNCHNILLFAASFLRYSSRLSDCHNRIFNCWRALVLFFPFFVPFPTPKLITLVPYLFIFLTHLSPSKGKKKKKLYHSHSQNRSISHLLELMSSLTGWSEVVPTWQWASRWSTEHSSPPHFSITRILSLFLSPSIDIALDIVASFSLHFPITYLFSSFVLLVHGFVLF